MGFKGIGLVIGFCFLHTVSFSQFEPLIKTILLADTLNTDHSREEIYVHYDRPYYELNDTIRLKGYIVLASNLNFSDSSRIAYIEILNSSGSVVKRISSYCFGANFDANLGLGKSDFREGDYLLRAYTNYMRNYGDSLFYVSRFKIIDPTIEGRSSPLQMKASERSDSIVQSSVLANRREQIDLQFLPEGGSFIADKLQRLGFKAINSQGRGVFLKGRIEDSRQKFISNFESVHNGMGVVWLKPMAGEIYTAILDNGLRFPLPSVKISGTQLQVTNQTGSDSIKIMVDVSPDLYNADYFFRASAKGISCAMGRILVRDQPHYLSISKEAFPSGICRFTLYDRNGLPLNERIILIDHEDHLHLELSTRKPVFSNRDSIHISLNAKNAKGIDVVGSFSVAVVDTSRVPYLPFSENILSYFLLSSDLKGLVEDPGYYFDHPQPEAIDALMLTQGWVQYDRFYLQHSFQHEKEFTITGKVTNIFNKPVAGTNITLFGKEGRSASFLMDTLSDKNGRFTFDHFPIFVNDSVNMLIRSLNKKGKQFGIGLDLDEPVFPAFNPKWLPVFHMNVIYDTTATRYAYQESLFLERLKKEKGYLPEVIVKSKTKVPGSKNLNPDGGADQVISTKTLESIPKQTLLEVLLKEVNGFNKGPFPHSMLQVYKVNGYIVVFVIDGYNINQQYEPVSESPTAFTEYEENYLKHIIAEEVAGIEIMSSPKNTMAYEKYFHVLSGALVSYVFIEITTYSGNGAFAKNVPGMYLYRPLVPVIGKSFYSPRYNSRSSDSSLVDYRSTIYWNPEVITNEKGEAKFSFYSSDSKGGYLLIIQGMDLNGGLGVTYLPIRVEP